MAQPEVEMGSCDFNNLKLHLCKQSGQRALYNGLRCSEDGLTELIFSLHHVASGIELRLSGSKHLYLLSYFPSPLFLALNR